MTSAMPSGDGTVTGTGTDRALDEDAVPATGLEPDTAGDAGGQTAASAAADVAPNSDPDVREAEAPDAAGTDTRPSSTGGDTSSSGNTGSDTTGLDEQDSRSGVTETRAEPPSDVTELDGPALENDEMRAGTADLQSSEKKTAEAKEIVDDLTANTQPSAPDTVMPG